ARAGSRELLEHLLRVGVRPGEGIHLAQKNQDRDQRHQDDVSDDAVNERLAAHAAAKLACEDWVVEEVFDQCLHEAPLTGKAGLLFDNERATIVPRWTPGSS